MTAPAPPSPPRQSWARRRWILGGVAFAIGVVLLVTGVVVALTRDRDTGSDKPSASPPASQRTQPVSAVTGRITDEKAGFSYASLGAPWVTAGGAWTKPGMFTSGQISPLKERNPNATFNATSLAGVPSAAELAGYTGSRDLATAAARVKTRVVKDLFTAKHDETSVRSGPVEVAGGGKGWLEQVRFDFPQARANGWPVTGDMMALLIVDRNRGDGHLPGMLVVSTPSAFATRGDMDQILNSVRVP